MNQLLKISEWSAGVTPAGASPPVRVVCLCAEWCGTCRDYRNTLNQLAAQWPQHEFLWLDVDHDEGLLGDLDIETFPTLLILRGDSILFAGVMLPHITHLERLLASLDDRPAIVAPEYAHLANALRRQAT